MEYWDAEMAMNLIGLILIAALSGVIVAVSLRLRAATSSARMWLDGDRLPEEDRQPERSAHSGRRVWLQDPFGLKGEPGLYHSAKDQLGS
ncbi:MAG: hypothetical protein AABO57_22490 [Acidobacteriota bacterium]